MHFVPSQQLNVNFHPHYMPCDFFVENVSVLLGRRMHVGSHPAALIYRGGLFMGIFCLNDLFFSVELSKNDSCLLR